MAETGFGNKVVSLIFKAYSVLNPLLLGIAAAGFIMAVVRLARKKKNHLGKQDFSIGLGSVLTMFAIFGIAFMYAFAIAWFSEFVWIRDGMADWILKFYGAGLVPLLSLFYCFGLCLFTRNFAQVLSSRKKHE